MKKLLFIVLLIALIGCKAKQTIEQEKVQTTSSIAKTTFANDSSIITIIYDMMNDFDDTSEINKPVKMIRPTLQNHQRYDNIEKAK